MNDLCSKIKQLSNAFEREGNRMLQRHGLTFAQAEIVRLVVQAHERGEPLNQRGIESALRLKNPTVTGTLNRLEAKGLVQRESAPGDGRIKLIKPTKKALDQHDQAQSAMALREKHLLKGITQAQKAQLMDALDKVLGNIEDMTEDGHE